MKRKSIQNMTLAAMFMAVGLVLPFLTGQIPAVGSALLPMHLPVLVCGLICGGPWGAAVGFILPLLRNLLFGMPPLYPVGIAMMFELATYGFVCGFLYSRSRWKCIISLYRCLIAAMLAGRVVWGAAELVLLGVAGNAFTFQAFLAGAFLNAVPGIILQLVFIPALMVALDRTGLVKFTRKKAAEEAGR